MTIKTLRFYHERGLLVPALVDPDSSYRYYNHQNVVRARIIGRLRSLEFSLDEIAEILAECEDERDLIERLGAKRDQLSRQIQSQSEIVRTLQIIIDKEREVSEMISQSKFEVGEKVLQPMLIAGIRMRGTYDQCGRGFGQLARKLGRCLGGKPMNLYYDCEHKDQDAEFEPCFPLRAKPARQIDGISVRQLEGGRCITLLHPGPYDELGRSYEKAFQYASEHGLHVVLPIREVYLKGPGMIFKGNPKNYLTEIQLLVESK